MRRRCNGHSRRPRADLQPTAADGAPPATRGDGIGHGPEESETNASGPCEDDDESDGESDYEGSELTEATSGGLRRKPRAGETAQRRRRS